ncbi:MAG: hypothetical protein ACPGJV_07580 [Bacteriovoracaceae bacterium]
MSNDKDKASWSETLKKIVSVGASAAFLTEDAIKNMLGDTPLSKDIISGFIQNAKNSKEEFLKSVKDEIVKNLKTVDPKRLMDDVLKDYEITINAKVSFEPKNKQAQNLDSEMSDEDA